MSSVQNTIDTVNAAATAIVTAESRVQPPSTVQKRRWGSCWSVYWCFGSSKHSKRIGHAVLGPEPASVPGPSVPATENPNQSSTIVIPFIAPPSSPASFLQSDPSSATQSPAGLLSLKSLSISAYSPGGTASIFAIGPYAHETQLVSPPVFSTFTTEPSTANFTPPPEPVHMTTPPSPEVPFAQLLTSSLARNRRYSGSNWKFPLSQYEFVPYQDPGSPGSNLISPGSVVSNSGTSSPFPGKCPIIEFRKGEPPKFLGYEHFSTRKWGSRVGSGSVTPSGWGSRLGSGNLTPNGGISRLGSGTVTPNGWEPPSRDSYLLENQISEVVSLANSDNGSEIESAVIDHRVSFELTVEDVPSCREKEPVISHSQQTAPMDYVSVPSNSLAEEKKCSSSMVVKETDGSSGKASVKEEDQCRRKHRNITFGSSKDFDFDNVKIEVLEKSSVDCEWWTSDKVASKESGLQNNWTFFPVLQPGVS